MAGWETGALYALVAMVVAGCRIRTVSLHFL
jgi:hypothetical protein